MKMGRIKQSTACQKLMKTTHHVASDGYKDIYIGQPANKGDVKCICTTQMF
jgi:hypothetical protein